MATLQREETLWTAHRERMFRFVLNRVEDAATAEDIVHDVLLRAYSNRTSLRDERKLEQWLYQITRNAVIDHYRSRRPADPIPENLPELNEASADARRELAGCILPFIDALPEHYRDAVRLAEIEGLTRQQAAHRLGLSLSGAKSRVQRGRKLLGDMMLECCRLEFDSAGGIMSYESHECGKSGPAGPDPCASC